MKNLFKIIVMLMFFYGYNVAIARPEENKGKNYFQFVIPCYHTQRQSGQTVNVYVRYAYKSKLSITEYPDYRALRSSILKYMEPTEEFPALTFWEILAQRMGNDLMNDYPLTGVSIQLEVLDNQNEEAYEPGDHGPTYTVGDISPLSIHH